MPFAMLDTDSFGSCMLDVDYQHILSYTPAPPCRQKPKGRQTAMPLVCTTALQGPGHSRVQFCMASLLATLVLDEEAMEIIRQRGEGHLVFEATLKLVRGTQQNTRDQTP